MRTVIPSNEKRSKASRNRFPNYQKVRTTPEPVGFNKYNSLACGKPTGSRFSPPYARAGTGFGNRFAFRRQGSAETGKPKASAGLNSKAQSQERLPGRQPYGSVPLWEDLTEWRNTEAVRLIDRKPAVPERNKGANRSSPAPCRVTAPISPRTTFGLLLPESAFSCAGHTACGRCGRPGFLIGSIAFPPGITVVRATPAEGREKVAGPLSTFALLSCRTSGENQGVALTTFFPPVRRVPAPGGRGTREAKPRIAVLQRTREIRVVPRPVWPFGKAPHHNGEGSAL